MIFAEVTRTSADAWLVASGLLVAFVAAGLWHRVLSPESVSARLNFWSLAYVSVTVMCTMVAINSVYFHDGGIEMTVQVTMSTMALLLATIFIVGAPVTQLAREDTLFGDALTLNRGYAIIVTVASVLPGVFSMIYLVWKLP